MGDAPVGMLVVRASVEESSAKPLRANVRLTNDTTKGFTSEVNLADAEAVLDVVREWLESVRSNVP